MHVEVAYATSEPTRPYAALDEAIVDCLDHLALGDEVALQTGFR